MVVPRGAPGRVPKAGSAGRPLETTPARVTSGCPRLDYPARLQKPLELATNCAARHCRRWHPPSYPHNEGTESANVVWECRG